MLGENQIGDGEDKMGKYSQGTPVRRGFRSLAAGGGGMKAGASATAVN